MPIKNRPATRSLPEFPQMSPAELADLSREAGRPLSNEDAHHFRRQKLRRLESEQYVYGKRQHQAGASLTEVLVVVAIVGILFAVFGPVAWDALQTTRELMAMVARVVPLAQR